MDAVRDDDGSNGGSDAIKLFMDPFFEEKEFDEQDNNSNDKQVHDNESGHDLGQQNRHAGLKVPLSA